MEIYDYQYNLEGWQVSYLPDLFAKFGKVAERLGCPKPTYSIVSSREVKKSRGSIFSHDVDVVMVHATVFSFPAQMAFEGYTFVGTVDHLAEGNVVNKADAEAEFPVRDGVCDHCGTKRKRTQTVVARKDDGTYYQFGKKCAKDYFGHNCFGELLNFLFPPERMMGDDEEWLCGRSRPKTYATRWVVAIAVAAVEQYGFASSASGSKSTKNRVSFQLHPWSQRYVKPEDRLVPVAVRDAHFQKADELIEWAKAQTGSDYLNNLRVLASETEIKEKYFGVLVSLPQAYANGQEFAKRKAEREAQWAQERAEKAAAGAVSQFLGKVGDRLSLCGTVELVKFFDSDFGGSYLVKIKTCDGNIVSSFVSASSAFMSKPVYDEQTGAYLHDGVLAAGDQVKFKGTVKSHEDFRGEKQTKLSRLALV